MKQSEIKNILNHIESSYRVNEWRLNGVDVWPLIRIRIWYELSYKLLENADANTSVSKWSQLINLVASPLIWLSKSLSDFKKSYFRIPQGDIFVLGDGVSFINIEGLFFDKFSDSIDLILGSKDISIVRADTTETFLKPRFSRSYYLQPRLNRIIFSALIAARIKRQEIVFPDFDQVLGISQEYNFEHLLDVDVLRFRSQKVYLFSKYFIRILKKKKFKAAMSVCYYSDLGFGLNLACAKVNLPSFDLQHGVQGKNHGAYGSWKNVPKIGYNVLPKYFLNWSELEKLAIDQWNENSTIHQSIVTGNLLAQVWQDLNLDSLEEPISTLDNLARGRPKILLSLGWGVSNKNHLKNVLNVINTTQEKYFWMIRLHPSMASDENSILELLSEFGVQKFEMELSSKLPLFSILDTCELHITHSSSCIIEASYFRKKSIITSDYGWSLLADQVDSKWIVKALEEVEIENQIQLNLSHAKINGNSSKILHDNLEWIGQLQSIVGKQ